MFLEALGDAIVLRVASPAPPAGHESPSRSFRRCNRPSALLAATTAQVESGTAIQAAVTWPRR